MSKQENKRWALLEEYADILKERATFSAKSDRLFEKVHTFFEKNKKPKELNEGSTAVGRPIYRFSWDDHPNHVHLIEKYTKHIKSGVTLQNRYGRIRSAILEDTDIEDPYMDDIKLVTSRINKEKGLTEKEKRYVERFGSEKLKKLIDLC